MEYIKNYQNCIIDSSKQHSIPFRYHFFDLQVPPPGGILHRTFTWNPSGGYYSLGFEDRQGSMVYMAPDTSDDRIRTTSEECFCFREEPDPPLTDEYLLSLNIGWQVIMEARKELEQKWTLLYRPIAAEMLFFMICSTCISTIAF